MILGCSCCRKIKVGLGGCGRFCGEVLVGCRLEGRGLLGKSEFVHLGIWASGHLGFWAFGHLVIWASGHLSISSFIIFTIFLFFLEIAKNDEKNPEKKFQKHQKNQKV